MPVVLLLFLWVVGACPAVLSAGLPNIVVLYADDMGYGDLGCQNPESKIATPNLDRLAAEGMRFTDAHSSSGICTPSRYALLTGRFHWRKFHDIVDSFDPPVLQPGERTLARMLKEKGYRTACIGKWHLGWNWDDIRKTEPIPAAEGGTRRRVLSPSDFHWDRPLSGGPLSHGFDSYFGDDVPNFPPYAWLENDRVLTVPSEVLSLTVKTREGDWEARPGPMTPGWDFYGVVPRLAEKAVEWIEKQRGLEGPFFLYVPFNSPHAPIVPGEAFTGSSRAGGYGDFVVQTDDVAGRILRALEKNGFAGSTLVVFTSDNGPEHYAYERLRVWGHRSFGPLRGLKRDLYEGGHRVPFIVRWPGVVEPGTVQDVLVSQVDLMATLGTVVGATFKAGEADDSHDFLAVLKGAAKGPRRTLVHNTLRGAYAIRHDHWVLIAHRTGAHTRVPSWFDAAEGYVAHEQPGELYDLRTDLAQKRNLYAELPGKVAELTTLLEQIRARGQVR